LKVKVKLFAEYYDLAGKKHIIELELPDGATVLDLARKLEEMFPRLRGRLVTSDGHIADEPKILVNGRNIDWLQGENTRLHDGDTVAFFPPAAGG